MQWRRTRKREEDDEVEDVVDDGLWPPAEIGGGAGKETS